MLPLTLILTSECLFLHSIKGQARAVESLVRAKMQHREFIILCLEDCSDWSNATTRRVVMQVCVIISFLSTNASRILVDVF